MKKTIISMLLTAIMLIALLPTTVFAAEQVASVTIGSTTTPYTSIDDAVAEWTGSNNSTLTLLADVTLTQPIQLASNQKYYLQLGTYTMTAAPGENAIEILSLGFPSRTERDCLYIYADDTTPGGINAGSKACIYYKYDPSTAIGPNSLDGYDRPRIYIRNGVFTSTGIGILADTSEGNGAQDKCPTLHIYNGVFNCDISLLRAKIAELRGGVFNGNFAAISGSTAYHWFSGGKFKSFPTTDDAWSANAKNKFGIATSWNYAKAGTYDLGVYIDDEGYLVLGGPVITAPGTDFEASTDHSSWGAFLFHVPDSDETQLISHLEFSSAKENGLYWTDISEAMEKTPSGEITIHADSIDFTESRFDGINFTGTLLLPTGNSLTVTLPDGAAPAWKVAAASDDEITVYDESSKTYILKDKRNVTFDSQGGTAVSAQTVADGSTATEPATPTRVGYDFQGWFMDANCTQAWSFDTPVVSTMTLYAKWTIKNYLVTLDYGMTNAPAGTMTVDHGTVLNPESPVFDGYIFMGWFADNTYQTAFDLATPIKAPTTIYAKFADYDADMAAIDGQIETLEQAIADLQAQINSNDADIADIQAKIADINALIDALKAADVTLEGKLSDAIAKAENDLKAEKEKLDARIEKLQQDMNKADADLKQAITNLDAAMQRGDTMLKDEIDILRQALEKAKAELLKADADNKAALEAKINAADETLGDAIKALEKNLDDAKAALQTTIDTKADTEAVNTAVANLQNAITALENAKDNYITADAALKAELEAAIAKAKQEAIDAAKGHIPFIGANGNWWIGEVDTGVDTNGIKGDPGADGVGIAKIEKTSTAGNVDTYTITLTNGKTYTFTVTNGANGVDGKDGKDGVNGTDGQDGESSPVIVAIAIASAALLSNIVLVIYIVTLKRKNALV